MRIPPWNQVLSVVLLACLASACSTAPDVASRRYLAAYMDDVRIGHSIRTRAVFADRVVTTHRSVVSVRTNNREIDKLSHYQFTESTDGVPISFRAFETSNGVFTRRLVGHINDGQLTARVMVDGEWKDHRFPWPQGALLPEGIRLLRIEKGLAAGTTYELLIFDARSLTALPCRVTVRPSVPVDILSTVIDLTPLEISRPGDTSGQVSVEYVNADFDTVKTISPSRGTQLIYVTLPRHLATMPTNPQEQAHLGMTSSPVSLSEAHRATPLTYTIKPRRGQLLLPGDNTQTVIKGDDGELLVTINRSDPSSASEIPYTGEDETLLAALATDTHVQPDNPRIADLARQAVGDVTDARQAAQLLQEYVYGYINRGKHYTGYGTSAEVIDGRYGDCTEHAVLLAAMCRAVGLPAQVVSGLAYAAGDDGVGRFASHAWVRVWIGEEWLHVDSTRKRVDAGCIMLTVGDESEKGFPSSLDKFGRFDIVAIAAYGEALAPPEELQDSADDVLAEVADDTQQETAIEEYPQVSDDEAGSDDASDDANDDAPTDPGDEDAPKQM